MASSNQQSLQKFNETVRVWLKKTVPESIRKLQRLIVLEALRALVYQTPADTGRTRGNWQVTIGVPTFDAIEVPEAAGGEQTSGQVASATFERGAAVLQALGEFEIVFIQNNVEWIEVLENGGFIPADPGPSKDRRKGRKDKVLVAGGFSTQAPNGMLKVTFTNLTARYAA